MRTHGQIPIWAVVGAGMLAALGGLAVYAGAAMFRFPSEPAMPPGVDLSMMLGYARDWRTEGNPFLALNPYPPLAAVMFAPLTAVPFAWAYGLMTAITLASFLSVALVLPWKACPGGDRVAIGLAALAGLASYGLGFEIRWGQFNVVAVACAAWGLYGFHRWRGRGGRWAAYALFSAAIQLKLYPAIWVVAFAQDPRAWKENLRRWIGLGAVNAALLLVMGPKVALDFLHSLRVQAEAPYVWAGNHSIQSFAEWAGHPACAPLLAGLVAAGFIGIAGLAARRGDRASFAGLVLAGALGAMLLPGVSHDYKLTVFSLALPFYWGSMNPIRRLRGRWGPAAGGAVLAFAFAWTLVPVAARPEAGQNCAPFLLLAGAALLGILVSDGEERNRHEMDGMAGRDGGGGADCGGNGVRRRAIGVGGESARDRDGQGAAV